MRIAVIKTAPLQARARTLASVLDEYLTVLAEGSIIAIASKIVSLCEGRVVKIGEATKENLVRTEADSYLPAAGNPYGIMLTVKNGLLIPTAGIDESNGQGHYVLWPEDPQRSANRIRKYLLARFPVRRVGVIITDSTTAPLRRGTAGVAIAHSGFLALRDYVGQPDIFGRELKVTNANVRDALAAAAVVAMGEGNEQTPLAVIDDVPFIEFQAYDPTAEELQELRIAMDEDLYAPLLKNAPWETGRNEGMVK